ncbi:hypothetical protein GCM10011352_43400 [Marinobacterium zhoushanense]|uniref:Uncharacterized protein n=1 Tax=Marinobacterium zhoushanense TaxID=1679163 RepID=A0ABQ1L1F5_9GAMM|nr:hypothetical protein GCM10011352_43400 [Marinobacterium zhoushanense]
MDLVTQVVILLIFVAIVTLVASVRSRRKGDKQGAKFELIQKNGAFFYINEREIVCPHCSQRQFILKQVLLNTSIASFFNMDWANKSASSLICMECGHILWFIQRPNSKN